MTRMALVPVEATGEMIDAIETSGGYRDSCKGTSFAGESGITAMLAASPSSGKVSAKQLKVVAEAVFNFVNDTDAGFSKQPKKVQNFCVNEARAVITALGLEVEE